MTLQEEIAQRVGQAPEAPGDYRLFGWRLNQGAQEKYRNDRLIYDQAVKEASAALVPQALNPLRDTSLSEVAGVAGYNPRDIATPEQYRTRVEESPSLVPKTALHYTAEGDAPMGMGRRAERVTPEGPPDLLQPSIADSGTMRGMELRYPESQWKYTPEPVRLQGPPNPARPEFYQRQSDDPIRTETQELDLNAPSTRAQQMLGMSGLKREGSWPRQSGNSQGGSTQFKYNQIAQAYGKDAADYWLAEGMLPQGLKAENISARTGSSSSRQHLMDTQAAGQDIKNQNLGRQYDDQHANTESLIRSRQNGIDIANQMLPYRKSLMEAEMQLKQRRLTGDSPELQQAQQKIDLAREKLTFLEKLVTATKGEVNDETRELLWQDLAGLGGIVGEIGKPGFWEKMNPLAPSPQPQRATGAAPPVTPQSPRPMQPTPQSQSGQSSPFQGAPSGKNVGDILNDPSGKPVATWDGKTWKAIQ